MQVLQGQANPETLVNENFDALSWAAVYARRPMQVSTPLQWGYYGGVWGGFDVAEDFVALADNATNYIVVQRSNGALSVSTSTTNWDAPSTHMRVYRVTTSGGVVTAIKDFRAGAGGVHGWPA
jgi:sugar lactone lactonase YvrE